MLAGKGRRGRTPSTMLRMVPLPAKSRGGFAGAAHSSPAFAGEGDRPQDGGGALHFPKNPLHHAAHGPPPREIAGRICGRGAFLPCICRGGGPSAGRWRGPSLPQEPPPPCCAWSPSPRNRGEDLRARRIPPLHLQGRGTVRRTVEGPFTSPRTPSTMLRMVPLPAKSRGGFAGAAHSSPAFAGEGDRPQDGGGALHFPKNPLHHAAHGPPPREIAGRICGRGAFLPCICRGGGPCVAWWRGFLRRRLQNEWGRTRQAAEAGDVAARNRIVAASAHPAGRLQVQAPAPGGTLHFGLLLPGGGR